MANVHRSIERRDDGNFTLRLDPEERKILDQLPSELVKQIEHRDDGTTYRLFPPAYSDDLGRQVEYDRLMRDDLQARHIETLRVFESTIAAEQLDEDQLYSWTRALNQLRLVLATRLDITEELDDDFDVEPDDPRAFAFALYDYLSHLQSEAVMALTGEI